jgi:hypothetical protein
MPDDASVKADKEAVPSPYAGGQARAVAVRRRARIGVRAAGAALGLGTLAIAGAFVLNNSDENVTAKLTQDARTRSPLYVTDGTRVQGHGYVVSTSDGSRMCIVHIGPSMDAGFPSTPDPPTQCEGSVPLIGLDPAGLPKVEGGRAGMSGFRGIWQDGTVADAELTSATYHPYTSGPSAFDDTQVPCSAPAGGWPKTGFPQEDYPTGLQADRNAHPGDALMTAVMHPDPMVSVLAVTTTDEAAAERVRTLLTPRYGKALCVVAIGLSEADFEQAMQGPPREDSTDLRRVDQAVPVTGMRVAVPWYVTVVDEKVQSALDKLPPDLVTLTAVIAPEK